jgi:enediyne biosynthesis protein E4
VAQPFDRVAFVPPAGELDTAHGQFWVGNPWMIVHTGKNLSGFERNRTFLNLGDNAFADISFLTGTDRDGDGRSAFAADLDGDGMQDLVVRQSGGGPLLLFKNQFPRRHYLRVSLRGTRSNGLGVGARLIAEIAGTGDSQPRGAPGGHGDRAKRTLVREMYPHNTYQSQQPCEVYFGLGDATSVTRLTIQWPSGVIQELTDVAADQNLCVTERATALAASAGQ